ncbi:MAG: DUF4382 domain-containing protein [Candidatus Binataceae bacterium]|nr:DUF4382 domain-containing protein [Candidatus Binataceae bacterium]
MKQLLSKHRLRLTNFAAIVAGTALIGAAGQLWAASGSVGLHLSNASRNGAACKAANVDHIYVTIADVKAHRVGAGGGFASLINQSNGPTQFDLMFANTEANEPIGSADCPIVDMGGNGLPAGKYGQIRLITVDNASSGTPVIPANTNACASLGDTVYNCVEAGGVFYPLVIPSGSQTGIKIPPGQFHRGGLTISVNQAVDLDIDINACQALVVRGGGNQHGHGHHHGGGGGGTTTYALKPALHTGEVSLNPIISGTVVVGTANGAGSTVTPGATTVANAQVWLETDSTQSVVEGTPSAPASNPTNAPVNSVVASTTTDANGNFVFCPVPTGSYDIVVDADAGSSANFTTNPSDATITTGVTPTADGLSGITIPLVEGTTTATTLSAQVSTQVSTAVPSTVAGVGDDIEFFGTQSFSAANPAKQAQIPPYSGTAVEPQTTTTTANSGCASVPTICPVGTNCVCFPVALPPDNPVVGPLGGTYTTGATPGDYALLGSASEIGTTTPACSPSQLVSVPAASYALPTLSFTGCN